MDPYLILNYMESDIPTVPSNLLHAGGTVAKLFGEVRQISIGGEPLSGREKSQARSSPVYMIHALTEDKSESYLVDQERVGMSAFQKRPWLRSIQRKSGGQYMVDLQIEVQVK